MNFNNTFDILKYDLSKFLPIRVVIRYNEGDIEGLTESSFSMCFSKSHIRIFWSGTAYSMFGKTTLCGISDAERQSIGTAINPLSEDSPIEIDWPKWLGATSKFDQRNAPFKIKVKND